LIILIPETGWEKWEVIYYINLVEGCEELRCEMDKNVMDTLSFGIENAILVILVRNI